MRYVAFLAVFLATPVRAAEPAPAPAQLEYFEKNVRPLFVEHCQQCHGPAKQQGGFRLDVKASFLAAKVVVPGDPAKSLLIQVLRHDGDVKMPPKGKLNDDAVRHLTEWVRLGAPWPDSANDPKVTRTVAEVRASHWSFRPVKTPTIPAVKERSWVRTPVDAFVLSQLEGRGLKPAASAEPRTLIRRLSFDLIGLPPTPEETDAFETAWQVNPESAWSTLVDRLLASPRYGERWARHWLDIARYADTKGYVFTEERRYPFAYTYRDYVVRAFNEDLPFDQFVMQQLAADQLPLGDDKRPLAAMGYLTLGRRFLNNTHDIIDDRIDVTMRGLQGLTVSCARCHDHKFDPIPTKDYYSLHGVFQSSIEPKELPLLSEPTRDVAYQAFEKELTKRTDAVAKFKEDNKTELTAKNRKVQNELKELEKKVDQWKLSAPPSAARGMVLQDDAKPRKPRVLVRGNPNNAGEEVPRQFLEVIAGEQRKPFTQGSGRLELARAIASKDNPLTARVLVNRVWLWHFGQGLVRTPSDFGLRGEAPTHPELLDYLASELVRSGWSIKHVHRLLLLSNTYRQTSVADAKTDNADPDNRLFGRTNRQRLDFEALRDALLFVSGRLDTTTGGPAVDLTTSPFTARRTIYGFIDRQNLPGLFRTFDFASPDTSTAQRHATTVPQQALFLLNSPFVVEQAKRFVARPELVAATDDAERIRRMYRLAFGRNADADEVTMGLQFLKASGGQAGERKLTPWEQYAQVLLLSNEFAFVD